MATEVHLHPLAGAKRAGELATLLDRLYRGGRRVVVWVGDEARRQVLDDFLWTAAKLGFLPHAQWHPGVDAGLEPILLVGEPVNPAHAEVLVVGDEPPPGDFAATFSEIHDLIAPGADGESRRQWWDDWQAGQATS